MTISIKRKPNGEYDLMDDDRRIGEVWRRPVGVGFGVRLNGVYWKGDEPSTRGGAVGITVRRLKDAAPFVERVLSMLSPGVKMKVTTTTRMYVHPADCSINRNMKGFPASAVLVDGDGEVVRRFDEDWTDDQILAALDFANYTYSKGVVVGKMEKENEIKRALNIG